MFRSVAWSLVTLFVTTNSAIAAVTAWTDVTVRVYDVTALDGHARQSALDRASTALAAASVMITWRVCSAGAHASACDARLAPGELAIRIVRLPGRTEPGGVRLGDALVDTYAGRGVLATIYLDRVLQLAKETGVDRNTLLGNAIAHELGHLLMATNVHGPVGLMRAFWSLDEMRNRRPTDWTFAPKDANAIHLGAEANRLRAGTLGTN